MRIPRTPSLSYASLSPRTARSSPAGATRKRTHAPPTRACGARRLRGTCSPSAAEIASWLRFTRSAARTGAVVGVAPKRGAAEPAAGAAAEARGELADDRAVVRHEHLRVRRALGDTE